MRERESEQARMRDSYAAHYERWTAPLRARPGAVQWLRRANETLKWLFYGAYGLLLVFAVWQSPGKAAALLIVTALGFAAVSIARARLDAPRPRTACGLDPLVEREGAGRSFPSRHVFSAFAIASSWLSVSVPVAAVLAVCAGVLGWCRVLGGVHFPRDVIAGTLAGIATGLVACGLALGM